VVDTFYVGQITEQSVIAHMGVSSRLGPAGFRRGVFSICAAAVAGAGDPRLA